MNDDEASYFIFARSAKMQCIGQSGPSFILVARNSRMADSRLVPGCRTLDASRCNVRVVNFFITHVFLSLVFVNKTPL